MSIEAEAAEKVLRMEIMLTEAVLRLMASGTVNLAMLLIAAMQKKQHVANSADFEKLINSKKELTAFPIHESELSKFSEIADKEKLTCGYIRNPEDPETINVVIKQEDAVLANKVRQQAGIEIRPGIDEKNANAGLSVNESKKLENTTENRPVSTPEAPTEKMTQEPAAKTSQTSTKQQVPQEQMDLLKKRLDGVKNAIDSGMSPAAGRVALAEIWEAMADYIKNMEQPAAEKAGQEKTADNAVEKTDKADDNEKSPEAPKKTRDKKTSVRKKVADITARAADATARAADVTARAAHEPQHLKSKAKPMEMEK